MRLSKKAAKTTIIVLAILLGLSLAALAGTLVYQYWTALQPTSVVVPENIITPESEQPDETAAGDGEDDALTPDERPDASPMTAGDAASGSGSGSTAASGSGLASASGRQADVLSLYSGHPDDNQVFRVTNMFPGDSETKYFCVRASHNKDVVVRYHADIRDGYEKLAEVLKCRIKLLSTGETLFDGPMSGMPVAVDHVAEVQSSATTDLYYEVTAYLDTSVGNDYQNCDLIADFRWWVEDTGALEPPQTGDKSPLVMYGLAAVALLCAAMLLLLTVRRRAAKRGKEDS